MPKFIHYDYNQNAMVVINFQDQLIAGTFEHAIHYLVENEIDMSVYFPAYKNEHNGRPAYDPAILLKIILFAYSKGITSSREIEWNCKTNIIFKALSCDTVPHNTTIASFISGHPQSVESVFEQILLTCDQQGLLGHELFAIDGCKMSSDASKEWSGTIKELKEKRKKIKNLITYHIEEDKRLTKNVPLEEERIQREKQANETLTKAFKKIDKFLKKAEPRIGSGKNKAEVKSNITDNQSAKMKTSKGTIQGYNGVTSADKKHQIIIDAQAFGQGPEQSTLQPVLKTIKERYTRLDINEDIYQTDIVVTADTGFADEPNMQYLYENNINGYIPDNQFRSRDDKFTNQKNKHGKRNQDNKKKTKSVLPASEFRYDPTDKTCICPEGHLMTLKKQGPNQRGIEMVFFHCRPTICKVCPRIKDCLQNPESAKKINGNGRQVSFVNESNRKPTYTDWMKLRVDSEKGKAIYGNRMSVIEPVFGNLSNKRLTKFSLRGKEKVQCQLKLFCLIHNIEKIKNYGQIAA